MSASYFLLNYIIKKLMLLEIRYDNDNDIDNDN